MFKSWSSNFSGVKKYLIADKNERLFKLDLRHTNLPVLGPGHDHGQCITMSLHRLDKTE